MSIEIEALLAERRKRYANFVLPETSPLSCTQSPSLSHTMHTTTYIKHTTKLFLFRTLSYTMTFSLYQAHSFALSSFSLTHSHAQRRTLTQDPFLIVCLNMEKNEGEKCFSEEVEQIQRKRENTLVVQSKQVDFPL